MKTMPLKIGFIGAGNMGEAFTGALIKSGTIEKENIFLSDVSKENLDRLKKTYGIHPIDDNFQLFSHCDIVILAVKPQVLPLVLSQIAQQMKSLRFDKRRRIISIAAGITLKKIEDLLYPQLDETSRQSLPIIRVMPNTPALVLAGMSGMCSNRYASPEDMQITREILETIGTVLEFQEEEIDAVTALSGSGPAYVFYLIESMMDAGISLGLQPEDACILTKATISGAIKLFIEKGESPEVLRQKVTSPGGTTEAAFRILENNGVKESIIEAITAAAKRSHELSEL